MKPEITPIIEEAAVFVRTHLPELCATWPEQRLQEWLLYFKAHQLWALLRDDAGKLIGIGIARPAREDQLEHRYAFDRMGEIMIVDLMITKTPQAREIIWTAMCRITGPRAFVAYRRLKYKDRGTLYPFQRFSKHVHELPL